MKREVLDEDVHMKIEERVILDERYRVGHAGRDKRDEEG